MYYTRGRERRCKNDSLDALTTVTQVTQDQMRNHWIV
jgi:hypothetical protein